MSLFGRPDGELVKDVSTLRRMMPFLMRSRNEAAVYFEQDIDVTHTLAFLDRINGEARRENQITFFHTMLAAYVRVLGERPRLNRFVVGKRLYQRTTIDLGFAVKKAYADDGGMTAVKVRFEADDTLERVAQRVDAQLLVGRGTAETSSEQEMRWLNHLPRSALAGAVSLQRALDHFNLLPAAMIDPDPLYSSMFLANLGSIGLDAAFHHLYEYGTTPIFVVIGQVKKTPVVREDGRIEARDLVLVRYTLDERIEDGYYCARSLERFKALLTRPEALEGASPRRPPHLRVATGE